MEYTFTLEALPIVGGVLIVLVLLICEIGSAGFGTGLPSGGYRYYIGAHTVLYLRQSGCRCRVYVLEGEARRRCRCTTPGAVLISRCGRPLRQKPK